MSVVSFMPPPIRPPPVLGAHGRPDPDHAAMPPADHATDRPLTRAALDALRDQHAAVPPQQHGGVGEIARWEPNCLVDLENGISENEPFFWKQMLHFSGNK